MWFSKIKLGGLSLLGEDSIYGGRIEGLLDSNSQNNESALITDGSKKGLSKKEPLTISLSLILKENISSIKAFNNFVQLNYILNQDNIMLEYVLFNDNKYYNLEVNKESISYSEDYNLINIVLKAFNPFIYKRDEKNLELELEIEGGYSFPVNGYSFPNEHIFNETIIGNTGIIYNDGFNTVYPVIEIVGEISNISIKNNTTGEELNINSNLNKNYTFDTFVVGSNNKFAHSAALAVAESPGEAYNPLYLYGGAGLGKTHLMHSIGHFVLEQNPNMKVLYVTSEQFTNEVIESIRSGNAAAMTKLRDKYRTVDVLLIDDVQFIIGKESTQEEFFHTFNVLHSAGKQIILSSDKPPKEMETLDERFRSRFEWGLIADIQPPDYETRMAILRKNAETYDREIDDEIIKYIATNIKSNIRFMYFAYIMFSPFGFNDPIY